MKIVVRVWEVAPNDRNMSRKMDAVRVIAALGLMLVAWPAIASGEAVALNADRGKHCLKSSLTFR